MAVMSAVDFVSDVYASELLGGYVCTGEHLLVWHDSEVHVWAMDSGMVVTPTDEPLDLAVHTVGVYHDVDTAEVFLSVAHSYTT